MTVISSLRRPAWNLHGAPPKSAGLPPPEMSQNLPPGWAAGLISIRCGFTLLSPGVKVNHGESLLAEKTLLGYSPSDPVLNSSFEGDRRIPLPVEATVR